MTKNINVESTYLFILIGSHSYELCLREGAVHYHPVGTSYTNYVYLGLVFMEGVQHYLQNAKQRDRYQCQPGISQLLSHFGSITEQMSLMNPHQSVISESRAAAFLCSDEPQSQKKTIKRDSTRVRFKTFVTASVNI